MSLIGCVNSRLHTSVIEQCILAAGGFGSRNRCDLHVVPHWQTPAIIVNLNLALGFGLTAKCFLNLKKYVISYFL